MMDKIAILLSILGVAIALRALWYSRSRNFVIAWTTIVNSMQDEDIRNGRKFLRFLQTQSEGKRLPRSEWLKMLERMNSSETFEEGNTEVTEETPAKQPSRLERDAKGAYDHFDLAGIMVLHSNIPSLLDVFIAEYQDSIIACWEQGSCFFKDRVKEMFSISANQGQVTARTRQELYQCFSVLYVLAKHRRDVALSSYPYYGWYDRLKLFQRHAIVSRKAKKERDELVAQAVRELGDSLG